MLTYDKYMHKGVLLFMLLALGLYASNEYTLSQIVGSAALNIRLMTNQIVKDHVAEAFRQEPDEIDRLIPALKVLADAASEARVVAGGINRAANAMIAHNSTENVNEIGRKVFTEYVVSKLSTNE